MRQLVLPVLINTIKITPKRNHQARGLKHFQQKCV